MRRPYIYLLTLTLLALASCKHDGPEYSQGEIRLSASMSEPVTRGMINAADFAREGTTVRVVDYLEGLDGTFPDAFRPETVSTGYYFDESLTYTGGSWEFVSGTPWRWTRTGTHNFYGWNITDGTVSCPFTPSYDSSGKTLSVPVLTLDQSYAGFDFCVSDWQAVDAASRSSDNVSLALKHAFMGLALTVSNGSTDIINVKSVTVSGINNKKSAVYSASGVTYADQGSTSFVASASVLEASSPLGKNDAIDLLTGSAATAEGNYILMWPQEASEVDAASITLNYTVEGLYSTEEGHESELELQTKTVYLKNATGLSSEGSALPMNAGYKYALDLQFQGKNIVLNLTVRDWDYSVYNYDYSSSSISTGDDGIGEMDFAAEYAGYDRSNRVVTLQNQSDVISGRIIIYAPTTGNWSITGYGTGADYFTISPASGTISITDSFQRVDFTVTPSATVPSSTVELHFNVAIQINGEWQDANSEFNRKDWKIRWEVM